MFLRFNETNKLWEYDTSAAATGAGPWLPLVLDTAFFKSTGPDGVRILITTNGFDLFKGDGSGRANVFAENFSSNTAMHASSGFYERGRANKLGDWIAYTPIWQNYGGSAPVLGNGTLQGGFTVIGKTVHFRILLIWGSTTNGSTGFFTFSLPPSPYHAAGNYVFGSGWVYGPAAQPFMVQLTPGGFHFGILNSVAPITIAPGYAYNPLMTAAVPFAWANPSYLWLHGTYEMA